MFSYKEICMKAIEILEKAHDSSEPLVAPVRLDLSITEACNTDCPYCWQTDHTNVGNLTLENLSTVIKDLCSWRPPWAIDITGGEPTIWKGFIEFVSLCRDKGIHNILVNTNAIKIANKNYAKKIIEAGVTTFGVSIDTLNPEKHLELRRFPFSKMQKALDNLYELKKTHKFGVSLNAVLSKLVTPEEVAAVKDYANDQGFGFFCQAVHLGPAVDKYRLSEQERDDRDRVLTWREESYHGDKNLKKVQNTDKFSRETHPLQKPGGRCFKAFTTLKIVINGDVRVCWNGPAPIGNILRQPILEIWRGAEAKRAREYIKNNKCSCLFDCDIYESLGLERITEKVMAKHGTDY
jgi:molybdenum cofactor biosynthesis enzyme MoaA